jgi:hypothetical protein
MINILRWKLIFMVFSSKSYIKLKVKFLIDSNLGYYICWYSRST